ncbi:MAG: hypothetical protein RXO54_04770 [Acidilobus sp.]
MGEALRRRLAVERGLTKVAAGLIADLDVFFRESTGKGFVQSLLEDPAATYRLATSRYPRSVIRAALRAALRLAFGAPSEDIDRALDALEAGLPSEFLRLLRMSAS